MARYFVDTADGDLFVKDEDGLNLPDTDTARREVVTALAEIARYNFGRGSKAPITATMRDETGKILFEATLTISER